MGVGSGVLVGGGGIEMNMEKELWEGRGGEDGRD